MLLWSEWNEVTSPSHDPHATGRAFQFDNMDLVLLCPDDDDDRHLLDWLYIAIER